MVFHTVKIFHVVKIFHAVKNLSLMYMNTETYTLVSYNTSWVNDCNDNQLHPNLSEAASIVAKQKDLKKMEVVTFGDDTNLGKLRMNLADTATEYIRSKMGNETTKGADFIALIEQMIHVPRGSHANYDAISDIFKEKGRDVINVQDIGNNEEFGILRRIKKLDLNDASVDGLKSGYNVVYDMIENYTLQNGGGEGIGIAFKDELMDTILEWNKIKHPVVERLNNGITHPIHKFEIKTSIKPAIVHYYSDDLGQVICFEEDGITPKYYNGSGQAADLGRPIIMTAGLKGTDTLNILVAAHGPNIFNMKFDVKNDKGEVIIGSDGKKVQKQVSQIIDKEPETVNELFTNVRESISRFINDGLSKTTINEPQNIKNVNVFFGGDMNDPRGQLLESLLDKGIEIKIKNKPYQVNFHYNLKERREANNAETSQYGYENLLSCCANKDSILADNGDKSRSPPGKSGPIDPTVINGYPADFHKPENFGYNGDYALFGSTLNSTSTLSLDNVPEQQYTDPETNVTVIASDHLPVISIATVIISPPVENVQSTTQTKLDVTRPTVSSSAKMIQNTNTNTNKNTKPAWRGGKRRTLKKRPKRTRRRGRRHPKRTAKK